MTLRDATEADLPAIVEIHNAAIASRISTAQLEHVRVEERRDWLRAHDREDRLIKSALTRIHTR